jgi:hypothetical protein
MSSPVAIDLGTTMDASSAPQPERRVLRRRTPKHSVRVTCQIGTLGLGPNVAMSLADLSEASARLVVNRALAVGQEVEVTLSEAAQSRPFKRQAKILRCTPRDAKSWWVVVNFDRRLEYGDLQRLV